METRPKRGLGRQGLDLWLDSHTWIPALEGVLPVLVDDLNTNLKQQVSCIGYPWSSARSNIAPQALRRPSVGMVDPTQGRDR